MNACFYVGPGATEWCWKYFPTKSPGELPIAGKSWCRHLVDQCSRLKINDIFIADCYFHDDLTVGMGAGDYWSLRLHYLPSIPCPQPEQLFAQHKDKKMQGAEQAGMVVFGRKSFILEAPVTDEWCYLRLVMDEHQQGQFYTSQDGKTWTKSGELFQAKEGHWIGAQVGLFCTRDNRKFNDAGWLDVDWFEIKL